MKTVTLTFSEHEVFILVKALHLLKPKLRAKPANFELCNFLIHDLTNNLVEMDAAKQKLQLPPIKGDLTV